MGGVERSAGTVPASRRGGERGDIVFGVDGNYPEIFRTTFAPGSNTPPGAFEKLEGGGALIGKQLAESRKLAVGDGIELPGPKGEKKYPVEGILENDLVGGGSGVSLSKGTLARDFNETEGEFLAVKAEPGSDREALSEGIGAVLRDYPQFTLYSNAERKGRIEGGFQRQYGFV